MELPDHSINYHGVLPAATACNVGDVLVPNSDKTAYIVATTANRAGRGSECVALSSFSGAGTGSVRVAQVGILPASKSGLTAGSKQLVRCSSAGRIERIASYTAGDDVIGYAEADGRVHLLFGVPWAEIAALAGSITLGGSNGDVVIKASATSTTGVTGSNGDVLYKTGGAWTSTPAVQVPAGSSGDVITNDGAGGLSNTPTLGASHGGTGLTSPGANGNVLTSNGAGAWTSSAPAASGAPVGASYLVVALDSTLTADRRIQGSSTITGTDGGANGDYTLSVTSGSLTNTHINGSAAIAYSKLNLSSSIVNADVAAGAAIASSKLAPPGATTQVISNQGGAFSASANFTHDNSGNIAASSSIGLGGGTQHTTGKVRFPYNSGAAVVLMGVKDSGGTDRSIVTFGAGDNWTAGNTSMDMTELGVQGQVSMTSSWQLTVNSTNRITAQSTENLAMFGSTSSVPSPLTRMIYIGNSASVPTTLTTPPSGGGFLFASGGDIYWQSSAGGTGVKLN